MKKKSIKKRPGKILLSLLTAFLLAIPFTNMAQSLSPKVVSSGGGSLSANSVLLDFSIGQIADELLAASGNILTQGFLQGEVVNTAVLDELENETNLRVYPVPAQNKLFVENNTTESECSFIMKDMQGRTVKMGSVKSKTSPIDIGALNTGIYFVLFSFNEQQPITKKFIKQ